MRNAVSRGSQATFVKTEKPRQKLKGSAKMELRSQRQSLPLGRGRRAGSEVGNPMTSWLSSAAA